MRPRHLSGHPLAGGVAAAGGSRGPVAGTVHGPQPEGGCLHQDAPVWKSPRIIHQSPATQLGSFHPKFNLAEIEFVEAAGQGTRGQEAASTAQFASAQKMFQALLAGKADPSTKTGWSSRWSSASSNKARSRRLKNRSKTSAILTTSRSITSVTPPSNFKGRQGRRPGVDRFRQPHLRPPASDHLHGQLHRSRPGGNPGFVDANASSGLPRPGCFSVSDEFALRPTMARPLQQAVLAANLRLVASGWSA